MSALKRIWHRYEKWECHRFGMWRNIKPEERPELIQKAVEFMGNTKDFGAAMRRVIYEWPLSCEHNLSNPNSNRRSWIGQAACTIEINCPEDVTREAWGQLELKLKRRANAVADKRISEWEQNHEGKNYQLHLYLGVQGISRRVTRRSRPEVGGKRPCTIVPAYLQGDLEKRYRSDEFGIY